MPGFVVGVDYGAATVVALLRRPDGTVRPLLFDGTPLLPSAVFVEPDGAEMIVGPNALRRARLDPAGYVPDALSHLDDGTVPVRGRRVPVTEIIGAGFARIGREAVRMGGGALPRLVVAHPGHWDDGRQAVLVEASAQAGLGVPTLVPAPIAVARQWADRIAGGVRPGRCVLVYDLGAEACEITLVRVTVTGLSVVASTVVHDVGGRALDRVVAHAVGAELSSAAPDEWWRLSVPVSTTDQRHRLDFLEAVRGAKEALSREPAVAFHVPLVEHGVSITRGQFERAAEPGIARTADEAMALLEAAQVGVHELADIILVGGSTRIPLVGEVLRERLGVRPTPSEEPELATAEGALSLAASGADPDAVAPPHAVPPVRGGRRVRVAAALAVGIALILVLAALQLGRRAGPAEGATPPGAGGGSSTAQVGTGPGADGSTAPEATDDAPPRGSPTRAPDASNGPAAPASPVVSPEVPAPLVIAVTVTPAAGTCSTDFEFVAQFTIVERGRYRWHWEFGGPDGYAYVGGDHDRDKNGSEKINRKFNASGTYWGRVRVTSPVSMVSAAADVVVTCA